MQSVKKLFAFLGIYPYNKDIVFYSKEISTMDEKLTMDDLSEELEASYKAAEEAGAKIRKILIPPGLP